MQKEEHELANGCTNSAAQFQCPIPVIRPLAHNRAQSNNPTDFVQMYRSAMLFFSHGVGQSLYRQDGVFLLCLAGFSSSQVTWLRTDLSPLNRALLDQCILCISTNYPECERVDLHNWSWKWSPASVFSWEPVFPHMVNSSVASAASPEATFATCDKNMLRIGQ